MTPGSFCPCSMEVARWSSEALAPTGPLECTLETEVDGKWNITLISGLIHRYVCVLFKHKSAYNCLPAHEGQPLQHEGAGLLHTPSVGAPVFKTKVGEAPENVQSLTGRDVPVSALFYFSEDPGLNESSSEESQRQQMSNMQHWFNCNLNLIHWTRLD